MKMEMFFKVYHDFLSPCITTITTSYPFGILTCFFPVDLQDNLLIRFVLTKIIVGIASLQILISFELLDLPGNATALQCFKEQGQKEWD